MNVVESVVELVQNESVRLDSGRLTALYRQLGERGAEDVVGRAVEELAVRLSHCRMLWRQAELDELRKGARSLVAIAEQIGMVKLAAVARDVTDAVDASDNVAVAATICRLIRVGERSLTAVWDLQDLSI